MRISLALFVFGLLLPVTRILADDVPPRSINTSGESVVYVTPDEVEINFGIETFNADLDKAKNANDQASTRLVGAIKALGVEQKYIQTANLDVEIQYRSARPWEGIAGYFARRQYSVKLKDTKLFEKLIDTALKSGANQLMGFEFRTTELRKYRDQARKMAIKAAKEKAIDLARELDCGVGKPRTISEGYAGFINNYAWRYNSAMSQNSMQQVPPEPEAGAESLPLGQIGIRAQVSVTFDLTDALTPAETAKDTPARSAPPGPR